MAIQLSNLISVKGKNRMLKQAFISHNEYGLFINVEAYNTAITDSLYNELHAFIRANEKDIIRAYYMVTGYKGNNIEIQRISFN